MKNISYVLLFAFLCSFTFYLKGQETNSIYPSEPFYYKSHSNASSLGAGPRFTRSFIIHYIVDSVSVDPNFMNNSVRIDSLRTFLRHVREDKRLQIDSIKFTGTASPDGYYEYNNWLSETRLDKLKKIIREEIEAPDSIIFNNDSYITWRRFRDAVANSDVSMRDSVLSILDMAPELIDWYKVQSTRKRMRTDLRMYKIRALNYGKVYEELKPILNDLRYAEVEFVLSRPMTFIPAEPKLLLEAPALTDTIYVPVYERILRRMYFKTNFIKWALLITNFAYEIDFARHWTFYLNAYYSKWDYFKSTIKFRFAGFQTGIRYWFNPIENDGWFVGGHFGYSYYNVAFDGEYRYQDLYGQTPTKGGGIEVGWRRQFGYKKLWRLEFTLGAGVYPLDYSVFHNTPDYKDGQWVERRKKTIFCLDEAAITVGYALDFYKKQKFRGLEPICIP